MATIAGAGAGACERKGRVFPVRVRRSIDARVESCHEVRRWSLLRSRGAGAEEALLFLSCESASGQWNEWQFSAFLPTSSVGLSVSNGHPAPAAARRWRICIASAAASSRLPSPAGASCPSQRPTSATARRQDTGGRLAPNAAARLLRSSRCNCHRTRERPLRPVRLNPRAKI